MKRINIEGFRHNTSTFNLMLGEGINEIMDYLEHMPNKNGILFTCVTCQHATGFIGDLGKCCKKPIYEVSG